MRLRLAFCVVALASVLISPPAEACSPGNCPAFPPLVDSGIPANAAGLFVQGARNPYLRGVRWHAFQDAVLVRADGGSSPMPFRTDAGFAFWELPGPLVAGEGYELHLDAGRCDFPNDAGPPYVFAFVAQPASALPLSAGTIAVKEQHFDSSVELNYGGCVGAAVPAQVAELEISPSAELVPFLGVTTFELLVNGTRWAFASPGDVSASGLVSHQRLVSPNDDVEPRRVDSIFRVCPRADGGALAYTSEGVTPEGPLTLVLRAQLAAGPTVESAPVQVELVCPEEVPAAGCGCGQAGAPLFAALACAVALLFRPKPSAR